MNKTKQYCSDFLFAVPSFLSGAARILDIFGYFDQYNRSQTGEEADLRARVCDWLVVQRDLDESWARLIDENPEYVDALVIAIKKDPHLERAIYRTAAKETANELQMAAQGA
jgi:hypothetical protein